MRCFIVKDCGFKYCVVIVFWTVLALADALGDKKVYRTSTTFWDDWGRTQLPDEDERPFLSITELPFILGEVYANTSGDLFLILDDARIAYVKKGYPWTQTTKLIVEEKPFREDSQLLRMKFRTHELELAKSYVIGKAVAMAKWLHDKWLPYDYFHCNAGHFMRYVLLGETPACPTGNCPLMRPTEVFLANADPSQRVYRSTTTFWDDWCSTDYPDFEDPRPFVSIYEVPFTWGEVYTNTSGDLFLILDKDRIAYVKKGYPWTHKTKLVIEKKPFRGNSRLLKMRFRTNALEVPGTYVRGKAITLAKWFHNKWLPYGYFHCHAGHFMRYILFGEVPGCPTEECPLMRPTDGVQAFHIERGQLTLKNGKGEDVIL